ncbi:Atp-binding protein, partial [Globisporangium polare]
MTSQALLSESSARTPEKPKSYGSIPAKGEEAAYASASWWSKLLFSYANPVMALGNTRQLNQDDLWALEGENKTGAAYQTFKKQYLEHDKSVERALVSTYGWDFFLCGVGSLVMAACGVFAPVVLHHVIDAFSAPVVDMDDLVLWLGAFFTSRLVNAFVGAHVNFQLQKVLLRLTVSLKSLLFEKAMKRSTTSKHEEDAVDISNLFTADMDNIVWSGTQLNSVWIMPIQIAAILYLIYQVLDLAVLAGVGVIGASFLVNMLVARGFIDAYEGLTSLKDSRMKVVKEVFGAIQVVKFNAWETNFVARIRSWRAKEMQLLAKYMYIVQVAIFLFFATPMFVSVASFAVYALVMQKTLTATKVFTSMVLFGSIRSPLSNFPEAIQTLFQARISLGRIETFLAMDEVDTSSISHEEAGYLTEAIINVENAAITWNAPSQTSPATPVLSNVNLEVKKGDFVVVHGAVGAGKSSLCSALL